MAVTWTLVDVNGASPGARTPALVLDLVNGMPYLPFCGAQVEFSGVADRGLEKGFLWDGAAWNVVNPATYPAATGSATNNRALATDYANENIVMLSGGNAFSYPTNFNETWLWDGSDWSLTGAAAPLSGSDVARDIACLCWDGNNEQVLLFGGRVSDGMSAAASDKTWLWDGVAWTELFPATKPSARYGCVMAPDVNNNIVLYGAIAPASLSDTWIWNGTTWTQYLGTGPTSPGTLGLDCGAIAYSPASELTILYLDMVQETWAWDGSAWEQLSPVSSPGVRFGSATAYDPQRGKIILNGGGATVGTGVDQDTHRLDGLHSTLGVFLPPRILN